MLGRAALLLILATASFACDVHDSRFPISPTAPTQTSPPTPTPLPPTNVGNGTVSIGSISPASGSIIRVRNCPPAGAATLTTLCTDIVHASIDVRVEADTPTSAVLVGFYDGARRCGVAYASGRTFPAGVTVSLDIATVFLSTEMNEGIGSTPTLDQPCALPVTTTRLAVQLFRQGSPQMPVLAREFAQSYTFTEP